MAIKNHLADVARRVASWLPDALLLGGASAVSYGASLVYFPAGFVVGGAFALVAGWMLARGGK